MVTETNARRIPGVVSFVAVRVNHDLVFIVPVGISKGIIYLVCQNSWFLGRITLIWSMELVDLRTGYVTEDKGVLQ